MLIVGYFAAAALTGTSGGVPQRAKDPATSASCKPGPAEASSASTLRPEPTAFCQYDLDEMYRRLARLLVAKAGSHSAEAAASAFDLPPAWTRFDSDRTAEYVTQATGKGGWKLRLSVSESAYPLDGKPPAFVPGRHPRRLMALNKLEIRYEIYIVLPEAAEKGLRCLTVGQAAQHLLDAGWSDVTATILVTDGGFAGPSFQSEVGPGNRLSIFFTMPKLTQRATAQDMAAACVTDVILEQSATTD